MVRRAAWVTFAILGGISAACGAFDSSDPDAPEPVGDAGPHDDAKAADRAPTDGATREDDASHANFSDMVEIKTSSADFYIDKTEATVDDWYKTTAATAWEVPAIQEKLPTSCKGDKAGWTKRASSACALPPSTRLTTAADEPVNCVDWCDAFAYCLARGKRLCGKIGGGPIPTNADGKGLETEATSLASEWTAACGGEARSPYPYGQSVVEASCNQSSTQPSPASQYPQCAGSVPGLLEMMGNLNEWENACTGDGQSAQCTARGGAYRSGVDNAGCQATHGGQLPVRLQAYDDVGIRCCADR